MSFDVHAETVNQVIATFRDERLKRAISQETLARMAGMSRSGVRHVEGGEIRPTLYTLLKIAEALNLNLSEVLAKGRADGSKKRRVT